MMRTRILLCSGFRDRAGALTAPSPPVRSLVIAAALLSLSLPALAGGPLTAAESPEESSILPHESSWKITASLLYTGGAPVAPQEPTQVAKVTVVDGGRLLKAEFESEKIGTITFERDGACSMFTVTDEEVEVLLDYYSNSVRSAAADGFDAESSRYQERVQRQYEKGHRLLEDERNVPAEGQAPPVVVALPHPDADKYLKRYGACYTATNYPADMTKETQDVFSWKLAVVDERHIWSSSMAEVHSMYQYHSWKRMTAAEVKTHEAKKAQGKKPKGGEK